MKTLIVYATKYGATQDCAKQLQEMMAGETVLHNLKDGVAVSLQEYDGVVVGGSIYAGAIRKEVKQFCDTHKDMLLQKRLGLFVSCSTPTPKGDGYLATAYAPELVSHAATKGAFGGELRLAKMNFLEKMLIKAITKKDATIAAPSIDRQAIQRFAVKFQE